MDTSYVMARFVSGIVFWVGFYWIFYFFLPSFLKRIKVKELTEEECKEILKEKFPTYYKYLHILYSLLFCMLMIGYVFIIGLTLMHLQKLYFTDKSLIMFQGNSVGIFFATTVFLAITLAWLTLSIITLPFPKFNRYQRADAVLKGWKFMSTPAKELGLALRFTAVMLLISIPLYFFSFFHYTKIDSKGVTYSPFLSLKDRIYPWNSVKEVNISVVTIPQEELPKYYYYLIFTDGSKINLWQRTIDFADDYFWQIDPIVKKNKIPINIKSISQETINRIKTTLSDNKTKENIFSIIKVAQK